MGLSKGTVTRKEQIDRYNIKCPVNYIKNIYKKTTTGINQVGGTLFTRNRIFINKTII